MGQPSPAVQGDSFLRAPRIEPSDLSPDDVAIVGVPHELTKISRPGTSAGPRAIREATLMMDFWGSRYAIPGLAEGFVDVDARRAYQYSREHVFDLGDLVMSPDLAANRDVISATARAIAERGALPVVLGGDHYITHPAVTGVVAGTGKTTALLSVDMHLDIGDEIPEFGRFNNATWVRRLIEERTIDPQRVVIFGVESLLIREEWEFAVANGVQIISAQRVMAEGVAATLRPALERALDGAEALYATLDIDAGGRCLVPGTGNHTGAVGLTPEQLLEVARIVGKLPLCGVDLVEVAPGLDPSGSTAGLAAAMLLEVLADRILIEVPFPG